MPEEIVMGGGGGNGRGTLLIPMKKPLRPKNLDKDVAKGTTDDRALLSEGESSHSSRSSSATKNLAALSSKYNTADPTDTRTALTTVNNTANTADIRLTTAGENDDGSDNRSVASSIDQLYPGFSKVLGNNLAQDLKDVDLTHSGDLLAARLEDFSLRFGNEDASENHLRMMSIVYRHSRYDSSQETTL